MNRFHLLSVDDEETTEAIAVPVSTEGTTKPSNPKKQDETRKSNKNNGKMDRRSRNLRKGEGEKHQTVGKGSWGRPTDGAIAEEQPASGDDNAEEDKGSEQTPKISYKTVKQYLAEQEEQQRRLASLNQMNLRRANEGAEVENNLEAVKKSEEIFTVGATNKKKTSTSTKEETGPVRMTLQDLNKVVPMAPKTRNVRDQKDSNRRENNGRKDDRSSHQKGDSQRRQPTNKNRRDYANKKAASIDLNDKVAFPSLA